MYMCCNFMDFSCESRCELIAIKTYEFKLFYSLLWCQVSALQPGEELKIGDVLSARLRTYDRLEVVWGLLGALLDSGSEIEHHSEFSFLPGWEALSKSEKLEKLANFPCHELHIFVWFRDREIFEEAVRPMLEVRLFRCVRLWAGW